AVARLSAASAGALAGHAGRAASRLFYEPAQGAGVDPDDETRRVPRTEVVPGTNGPFHIDLPPTRVYRVHPYALGRPAGSPASLAVGTSDVDAGDITLARAAHLVATVE